MIASPSSIVPAVRSIERSAPRRARAPTTVAASSMPKT
jgi:hypothetical protein